VLVCCRPFPASTLEVFGDGPRSSCNCSYSSTGQNCVPIEAKDCVAETPRALAISLCKIYEVRGKKFISKLCFPCHVKGYNNAPCQPPTTGRKLKLKIKFFFKRRWRGNFRTLRWPNLKFKVALSLPQNQPVSTTMSHRGLGNEGVKNIF
jgi:hypothetical protein